MNYVVEIVNASTDETVQSIDCGENERKAERVERGALVNLSENYFTRIVERAK